MQNSRRSFIKKSMLASAGMISMSQIVQSAVNASTETNASKLKLKERSVILFQGDSITDARRKRDVATCNSFDQLGPGYAYLTSCRILEKQAALQPQIYNKGISGNKVYQLRERWDTDSIALKPDVLSILIGVNDYWHTLKGRYDSTAEKYVKGYRELLQHTKDKLPDVQLVIGEPFVLKGGNAIRESEWFPMITEYSHGAKMLAKEFDAVFVPYQAGFNAAMKIAPVSFWSIDGVHPELPGRQLMANMWLKATGL